MEIKEYLGILRKNIKTVVLAIAIVTFSALVFSFVKHPYYEASISFLISRVGTDSASDYKYDDYYALMADDLVAETAEQWLKNPETVKNIYKDAGVNENFYSLKDLARKFKVSKLTAQLVEVRFKTEKSEDAIKITASASRVLKNKISLINNPDSKSGIFKITESEPVILEVKPDLALNFFVGIISGLILGVFAALGKEYVN